MSSEMTLLPVVEHGWRSGFINLLRKENSTWWGTRKWWVQALIWIFISNGVIAFILWVIPLLDPSSKTALNGSGVYEMTRVFLQMETFFAPFGVMILAQGLIVNEKKSGTAAWLLSNPVSRSSFLTSKLFSHGWAIFVIVIAVPSIVAFLQISLKAGIYINPLPFIYATGGICLLLLFFLALTLMLGTMFNTTGPVIGIPIAVLIGMSILPQILGKLTPWLISILPSRLAELAFVIVMRQALPTDWYFPLISTGILVVIFIAVGILRFAKEEF